MPVTMENTKIQRLDFSKPPPGYEIEQVDLFGGEMTWVVHPPFGASLDGEDTESSAIAAAWAHYKARHDPPGVLVTGNDMLRRAAWFAEVGPWYASGFASIIEARIAAWGWYEQRLSWSDEQVAAVERWLTEGGEVPEVLHG